jgi:DNA-binding IclR family transcriptional regulator
MEHATAIDKALDVLFHLHGQHAPQRVSEIGRALGLPKSSAHRLLAALRRRELVEQDEAGRYRPGAGLLGLALGVLDREPLVAAARSTLEHQAASLGETFFLVSARGGRLIVLDKVEGTGLLRVSPQVGSAVPAHASAVGKLYLAHAPELVTLPRPLPRYTPHTITSLPALMKQVQAVAAQGHALSRGEWIDALTVVAAPLFRQARMLGAVCVALAASGKSGLDERRAIAGAEQAATAVSARLGGER